MNNLEKTMKSPRRILLPFLAMTAMLPALWSCGTSAAPGDDVFSPDSVELSRWDHPVQDMPDSGCVKMRIRSIGGSLGKVFNDSVSRHLAAAERLGITPVGDDTRSLWENSRGLVKVASCREYYLAPLTHSYPYLVPEAAELLREIGARFADSLQARGGGAYRPKVTSVLRTPHTVGRLRRVNVNASRQTSAHQYATTFDISHSKFVCDDTTGVRRSAEDLKNLMAEVLKALRDEGRCYVKNERKQACFHITVRPPEDYGTKETSGQ